MKEKIVIQTERLHVRPWQESDRETFHLVMSNPKVHTYTGEEPWSVEQTKSAMAWFMEHNRGWAWKPGYFYFNCPLILCSTGQLIGRVGLNPFQNPLQIKAELPEIPEIEWTLGPDHWGQGYATEIGRAMLRYGFEEAGFDEIIGFALPQHTASRQVMQKIGMAYIGEHEYREETPSFYQIKKKAFENRAMEITD